MAQPLNHFKERLQIKFDDFSYLGNNISVENSVHKYISVRINKAMPSYCSLRNIWKANVYRLKTKVWLFTATSYQYYYIDAKSGESTRIICTSWMYFKPNVYGRYAIYSGQIRYPMKICTEAQILYQ